MVKTKYILLIILFIVLDQLTKNFFKDKHFSIINYTENSGAAFSLFQGFTLLLITISLIVLIITLYYFITLTKLNLKLNYSFILIISGTSGNLIDRIFLGVVRDFIDFKIWPIFNLADSYNVIGFILLLIYFNRKSSK
ncbi:signal peptidase II [Candidatus Woesearchaeota archaeon]|nr:signal peptidase II [Candidatus Woesearchaeota archaeon]